MTRRLLALLVSALAAPAAVAQPDVIPPPAVPLPTAPSGTTPPAAPAGPAAPKPDRLPEFEVQMADGSTLMVTVNDPTATVQTKYGTLTVPMKDVLKVELGFRFPDGVEAKVDAAVADLGSPAFATREAAEKALLKFGGYAVPAVRRAGKHTDPEVRRRAESVLVKLTREVPAEKLPGKEYDTVETAEFTVKGRLVNTTLKARTRYFGDAVLQLSEAKQLTAVSAGGSELTLSAAEYGKQGMGNWLDTKIDVSEGRPLEVTSTGQIDLWPQQGGQGQYVCGPNGNRFNPGTGMPVPQAMMGGGGRMMPQMIQSPGAVTGRIGPNGTPFFIGASLKLPKATASGRLYLVVQPSPWGNESVGSYKVRVTAGE